jgi:HK97 family phage portal protein
MSFVTAIGRRVTGSVAARRMVAAAPVAFAAASRGGLFSAQGGSGNVETQLRAMGQVGTLFAIVDKLATGVAAVEWKLYRKGATEDDRTEVQTHPALMVLNRPNSFYNRQELFEAGQQHQDLTGEMWWIIARNPRVNMPAEIWPVRPDKMQPVTSAENFIDGYVYSSPDGIKVPLRRDEVIFIRRPNPLDPYRGVGPIQSVLMYVDSERYSVEWNRNFFLNGAVPGGIIEIENRLSDAEFDRMSSRWSEQHKGVSNAHRVAILENAKWVDTKYTQKEMQFVELSKLADDKMRRAFGFPKPMLGDTEDSNRAVAQAAEYVFARWLIVPRLERIKAALNNEFLSMFPGSDGLEFSYESPVPEDEEAENAERDSKVSALVALIDKGADPGAAQEWLGLPEMFPTEVGKVGKRDLVEAVQKIYLGVNTVITSDEARTILNGYGADLPVPGPPFPAPVPSGPPPGGSGAAPAAGDVARLARYIMAAPEGHLRDERVEALRELARLADEHRDQALPW